MKKKITLLLLLASGSALFAQNGIGIGIKNPDPAAALHIHSDNKGILIPRLELTSLTTFTLGGTSTDTMPEGVMVYNNVGTTDIPLGFYYWTPPGTDPLTEPGKWELIVNQTNLDNRVDKITEELYTRIEELTKNLGGTSAADKSYLVSFNPTSAKATDGFSYLVPKLDTDNKIVGYDLEPIDFEAVVAAGQAMTFFRESKEKLSTDGPEEVTGYMYFGEQAIIGYLSKNPGSSLASIPDSLGYKIDVVGVVNQNFETILEKNKTVIESIVNKIEGSVKLVTDTLNGKKIYKFTYLEGGKEVVVDFNTMETKTTITGKEVVDNGGVEEVVDKVLESSLPVADSLKKGEIFYTYKNEADVSVVINLSEDILHSFKENETLKSELLKVIELVGGGGNVYYGNVAAADATPVNGLYTIKDDGDKEIIDISDTILNTINTSTLVQQKIIDLNTVHLITGAGVFTNVYVDSIPVLKGLYEVKITGHGTTGYNSSLDFTTKLVLNDATKVLKIQLFKKDGDLITDKVTNVIYDSGNGLNFDFGSGQMYTSFPAGDYLLAVEYLGKK